MMPHPPSEGEDLTRYGDEPTSTSVKKNPTNICSCRGLHFAMAADKKYKAKARHREYSKSLPTGVQETEAKGASDAKAKEGATNTTSAHASAMYDKVG